MKFVKMAAALLLAAGAVLLAARWAGERPNVRETMAAGKEPCMAVLMYHSVNSSPKKAGEYVITPGELEQDLKTIGEMGCTTVSASEVLDHLENGTPLPPRPVLLTFDDGYYNNYLNAFPLLKKYNCKALINLIVGETEKYSKIDENRENYSNITWPMAREMVKSGLVELGNHTYDLHDLKGRRGVMQQEGESKEDYFAAVGEDIKKAQDLCEKETGARPRVFAYPFGSFSPASEELMQSLGFEATLGVEGRPYYFEREDARCRIPRYNRPHGCDVGEILREVFGENP